MARPSNRDETRRRLIEQGVDALREQGLTVGLDAVSLERAHRDADVPRSTAYSAWADPDDDRSPQEAYRRAVLREILENPVHENNFGNTIDALGSIDLSGLDGPPSQRRHVVRELIRLGTAANIRTIAESWTWPIISALQSSVASVPESERDQELVASLRRSDENQITIVIRDIYAPYMELVGKRPRTTIDGGDTMQAFAVAAAALAEGLAPRYIYDPDSVACVEHHTDDGPEAWTLFGLGVEALIEYFFEDIPDDE